MFRILTIALSLALATPSHAGLFSKVPEVEDFCDAPIEEDWVPAVFSQSIPVLATGENAKFHNAKVERVAVAPVRDRNGNFFTGGVVGLFKNQKHAVRGAEALTERFGNFQELGGSLIWTDREGEFAGQVRLLDEGYALLLVCDLD